MVFHTCIIYSTLSRQLPVLLLLFSVPTSPLQFIDSEFHYVSFIHRHTVFWYYLTPSFSFPSSPLSHAPKTVPQLYSWYMCVCVWGWVCTHIYFRSRFQSWDICVSEPDDLQFYPFSANDTIYSSSWMNSIPLCTYTTFSLSFHQLKGI
jgi:hypothetical protein